MELTAHYEPSHVYLNPLDEKYFSVNGTLINVKGGIELKGKIVVPKKIGEVVITGLNTGCF
jgi:hypothetical protein